MTCTTPEECYRRFETASKQINEIHTVLLGLDGQGGLMRRVDEQEAKIEELRTFRTKTVGMAIGASAILSALGVKISEWLGWK